jgi:hypothetical protein
MSTSTRCAISRVVIAVGLLLLIAAAFLAGHHEQAFAFTAGLAGLGAIGGGLAYLANHGRRQP